MSRSLMISTLPNSVLYPHLVLCPHLVVCLTQIDHANRALLTSSFFPLFLGYDPLLDLPNVPVTS